MSEGNPPTVAAAEPQIDQAKLNALVARMQHEQNFVMGLLAGIVAAIAGALLWAGITAATQYQIGWMAVGIGFLVGFAVRLFGKGMSSIYGVMGAILSLAGCLLGNLLSISIFGAKELDIPVMEFISRLNPNIAGQLMAATFSPMDLLFYAIAVYEGYRFSIRGITEDDLRRHHVRRTENRLARAQRASGATQSGRGSPRHGGARIAFHWNHADSAAPCLRRVTATLTRRARIAFHWNHAD